MPRNDHGYASRRIFSFPRSEYDRSSKGAHATHHVDNRAPSEIDMAMP